MQTQDDDDLPVGIVPERATSAAIEKVDSVDEDFGRNPLDEVGLVPEIRTRRLTEQDKARLASLQQKRLEVLRQEVVKELKQSKQVSGLTRSWWAVITAILITGSVACILFAFSQTVQLLAALNSLPTPLRYAGFAIVAAITGLLLFFVARLAVALYRLRENRQISMVEFRALENRRELQELTKAHSDLAKDRLRIWLTDYPLETKAHQAFLVACGLSDDKVRELRDAKQELLAKIHVWAWGPWVEKFARKFQVVLDSAAKNVIQDYALTVGVKTAISPSAIVDMAVVVYSSFGMLGSLCHIYQLRVGPLTLVRLAGTVFSQAYLAGRIEDAPVEDWLSEGVNKTLASFGKVNLPIVGDIAGKLAGPGIQGVVNGRLISRLGTTTQRLLRPVETL